MTAHLAQLTVLGPLVGSLLAFILGRRNALAFTLANLGTAVGLISAGWLCASFLTSSPPTQQLTTIGSLPLGERLRAPMELHLSAPMVLVATVAGFVSLIVQMYARWYLYSDPRYRIFASTVALFSAAMMLVVLSNDVLLTLVGWEVMGWCSYLLIGHESNNPEPRRAAVKAFLVTRLADAPLIIGFAILAISAKSTQITHILDVWTGADVPHLRGLAMAGIVCGVLGKSAQLPFTDWLPDAMEGPTPASALIHAATMVAAGTVILAQVHPILQSTFVVRRVLVIVAIVTAIWAAFSAFCQPDIKRLLAWSTVSQVALMLIAVAAVPRGKSYDTAMLQLVGHAFFKSLLFLMVGWLSVVIGSTLVTRLEGSIRKLPSTFGPVFAGLFTMAGLPPTVAFFSKDFILENAGSMQTQGSNLGALTFVSMFLIIIGTAAYSSRAWFILQHRTTLDRRGDQQILTDSHTVEDVGIVEMLQTSPEVDEFGDEISADEEEIDIDVLPRPGLPVRFALWLLALGGIAGGLLAYTPLLSLDTHSFNYPLMGASLLLVVATGLLVRMMSLHQLYGDAARRLPRRLPLAASRGFGLDRLYMTVVARPVMALARGVYRADGVIDASTQQLGKGFVTAGRHLDAVHTRRPSTGLMWIVVGVVLAAVLGVSLW